jgi:hypothetical protein
MTPQELLKHLKTAGDSTHAANFVYLQKLNTFCQGHARQDPGVNSKKKPDSDEEEKEEEKREEEEEDLAAASDSNDVSVSKLIHMHVIMPNKDQKHRLPQTTIKIQCLKL